MGIQGPGVETYPAGSAPVVETIDGGREQIDAIDDQLLELLNQRTQVALAIAAIKRRTGSTGMDIIREDEILGRLAELNRGPLSEAGVSDVFISLFRVTREAQQAWLSSTESEQPS